VSIHTILRRSPDEGNAQYPRTKAQKNSLVVPVNSSQTRVTARSRGSSGLYPDLLFAVRRAAGLSQRELAQRTGVPQPTIAAIEAGRRDPRVGTLAKLVDGCGWTLTMFRQKGKGIDRAQIRRLLALTPEERLRRGVAEANRRMIVDKRR
jgi:transcriptional regulator with XRE-family HTH domain